MHDAMHPERKAEWAREEEPRLDLEALETPAFHDRLVRCRREAVHRPAGMVSDMGRVK